MPPSRSAVDPEVLEDLKCAAQSCTFLEAVGQPVEFWEALCMTNAHRAFVRQQIERLRMMGGGSRAQIAQPLMERITEIRGRLRDRVEALRRLLGGIPDLSSEIAQCEMLIGFAVASAKGQESVDRWVSDPEEGIAQAAPKLRAIAGIADAYREALKPWQPPPPRSLAAGPKGTKAPPAPPAANQAQEPSSEAMEQAAFFVETAAAPPPPETRAVGAADGPAPGVVPAVPPPPAAASAPSSEPPASVILPSGVDLEILEDIRRVEQCRRIFVQTHQGIEAWEVFMLVMLDRDATKQKIERLLGFKAASQADGFKEGALALFGDILKLRAKYGRFVRLLREFLATCPVGSFGKDTMEMALGFIVVSDRGRERAQFWIDEPKRYRQEATGRLEDIINRAMKYQTALRMLSEAGG